MAYLEQFSFESPKMLVFCLGGHTEYGKLEVHDVVFVVAKTDKEAIEKMRKAWFGTQKSLHVDSWLIVESINGYEIRITKTKPPNKNTHLYFVNLGYYIPLQIGEHHFMTLVTAGSKREAMKLAMNECSSDLHMLHLDDLHDLDGCINIDKVDEYFITLEYTGLDKDLAQPINGYLNLRSLSEMAPNLDQ